MRDFVILCDFVILRDFVITKSQINHEITLIIQCNHTHIHSQSFESQSRPNHAVSLKVSRLSYSGGPTRPILTYFGGFQKLSFFDIKILPQELIVRKFGKYPLQLAFANIWRAK